MCCLPRIWCAVVMLATGFILAESLQAQSAPENDNFDDERLRYEEWRLEWKRNNLKALRVPVAKEVESIVVDLGKYYSPVGDGPQLPQFSLPRKYFAPVLGTFRDFYVMKNPTYSRSELGSLLITTNKGERVRISFFWVGGNGALLFSLKGTRCSTQIREQGVAANQMGVLQELLRRGYLER